MKLSDKILLGFLGLIFVYLTAVFAEIRLKGSPNTIDENNSTAETVEVPHLTHLVLNNVEKTIHIIAADTPRLEVRSLSGDLLRKLKYRISGDTLILSHHEENEMPAKITVFVPRNNFTGMTVNSTIAVVAQLEQDHLYIYQNSGRIWMSESTIKTIQVDASQNSLLNISSTELDTLSAKVEGSQVILSSPIGLLKGSMKQSSLLQLKEVGVIQFEKDKTSRINLYQ